MGGIVLKLFMQKEVIHTRITASYLKENAKDLEVYIASINSNIEIFNIQINLNLE